MDTSFEAMDTSFEQALAEAQSSWMDFDGVESVGQGERNDLPCIRVSVSIRTDDVRQRIPAYFQGHPVEIVESGVISAGG